MNRCRVLALVGVVSLGVGGMLGVPAASGAVALPGTGAPPKAKAGEKSLVGTMAGELLLLQ